MSQLDTAPQPQRIRYVPGLDGLRGAAVVVVVLFHLGHLKGGYLGVDLFFVLSGFLITSLLLAEGRASSHIGLAHFWERRARRLLPALGVMLVGVAAYAKFAAQPEELHRIRWDGVATMLYVANWREIFGKADYWALFSSPSPLDHTWSLAIEEQFYLVWPLVFVVMLAFVRRRKGRSLAAITLVLSLVLGAVSLACAAIFQRLDGWDRVYYGTDTRAFAILAGAAVAAHIAWRGPLRPGWPRRALEVGGVAAAVVLGVAWFALDGASGLAHHGGLAACSIAAAVLVGAVAHPVPGVVGRAFSWKPLRWLGLISYGIYLYHWPIIVWLNPDRVHLRGWPLAAVDIAVTLAVSFVSYKWIEQPIRHGFTWRRRTNVLILAGGFAAVALLVLAATRYAPLSPDKQLDEAVGTADVRDGPRVMLIGNSVAHFLASDGFNAVSTHPGMTTYDAARDGCSEPPSEKFRDSQGKVTFQFGGTCDRNWTQALALFHPDYVVYARNGISDADFWHDGRWIGACSPAFHSWSSARLDADATRFAAAGATLVLVTSVPSTPASLTPPTEAYKRAVECGNQVLRDVAAARPESVKLVDLFAHECVDKDDCRSTISDGEPLRKDGTHYQGAGARYVSKWILSEIGIATSSH